MIVLDTNVLSEMMRERPDAVFGTWMHIQDPVTQFTTAVCEAEILYGLSLLPTGRRRTELAKAAAAVFASLSGRILPFDSAAAVAFAGISASRRRLGRPIGESDAQIAAIARVHGATVATRDVADFADCGVHVISPWTTVQR
jgi:predicted nucleic acid-binding protein